MINGLELYHLSFVTCHLSLIIRHLSFVTCHLSLVTNKKLGNFFCLLSFFVLPLPPKKEVKNSSILLLHTYL